MQWGQIILKQLINRLFVNKVKQNEGYDFLFADEVYIPIYKYTLKITKRKVIKLNLVEEKVLQIIQAGIYQVNEIARILGLKRQFLDITLADLYTKDLISISSDICKLLKKGEQALAKLERVEKSQDILKDVYMDSLLGKVLSDVSLYQFSEKVLHNDGKLQPSILSDDIKAVRACFDEIQEIFDQEYNQGEGINRIGSETQELLTIDNIEDLFVCFLKIPITVYVSSNSLEIDVAAARKKYTELLAAYKDEIIRQINEKKIFKNHFVKKRMREKYPVCCFEPDEELYNLLKVEHFRRGKHSKNEDNILSHIFSTRKLMDGEEETLLEFFGKDAQCVILKVDNLDDWGADRNFIGKLSKYVGKAKLYIEYADCKNIEKSLNKIERGHAVEKCNKKDNGQFLCWQYDDQYEVYGIPVKRKAINDSTICIKIEYYLCMLQKFMR